MLHLKEKEKIPKKKEKEKIPEEIKII